MKKEKGFVSFIILIALWIIGLCMFIMDWAIIDVRTTEKEKIHIVVPVPMQLVSMAMHFVPKEQMHANIPPEFQQYKGLIIHALDELSNSPNATLISVQSPEAQIKIAKKNTKLILDVISKEATIHCVIPLKATAKIIDQLN